MSRIPRPEPDEFSHFYTGYIAALGDQDPVEVLGRQLPTLRAACAGLSDADALYRYAPGKWSVKEVVGHLSDAERIFAYRALRIARGDQTPLPGWDENVYVDAAGFDRRPLAELLDELESVRAGTLSLLRGLGPEVWARRGTANDHPVTVRAIVHIIPGHTEHHLRILAERYRLPVAVAAAPAE